MRPLFQREKDLKLEAMEEFKAWALMEETFWRQKSREILLKEGIETQDSPTKWQTLIEEGTKF